MPIASKGYTIRKKQDKGLPKKYQSTYGAGYPPPPPVCLSQEFPIQHRLLQRKGRVPLQAKGTLRAAEHPSFPSPMGERPMGFNEKHNFAAVRSLSAFICGVFKHAASTFIFPPPV